MKAKQITYSRLVSKGNYENAKIEITLEVETGEKAADVLKAAKKFVNDAIAVENISASEIVKAKAIIDNPYHHTGAQIDEATALLAKSNKIGEDLPF